MQAIRFIFVILLIISLILYAFVFFKQSFFYLNFWGLLISTVAQICLFIGSGVEVCRQEQLRKKVKKEKLIKSRLWIKGIFFYNQAAPFIITANIIYWFPMTSIREDLKLTTQLFYEKKMKIDWRCYMVDFSHLIPLASLIFELGMNKIRIPLHHLAYTLFLTCTYLLLTYILQIVANDKAIYFKSLNWNCEKDFSFLVVKEDKDVEYIMDKTCEAR